MTAPDGPAVTPVFLVECVVCGRLAHSRQEATGRYVALVHELRRGPGHPVLISPAHLGPVLPEQAT